MMKRIISVFILLILVISLAGCGSGSTSGSSPASVAVSKTPEENIRAAIGPDTGSKDKADEVTVAKGDNGSYIVTYNFIPLGSESYYQEVGMRMSDSVRKLYSSDTSIDKLTFIIDGEIKDAYGNATWTPIVSFGVDRTLYKKINWDSFDSSKLLDISYNVKALR